MCGSRGLAPAASLAAAVSAAVLTFSSPAFGQDSLSAAPTLTADSRPGGVGSAVPVPLSRLAGQIRLDGIVDEPAWEAIAPLPMFMWAPVHGGEPTEVTEIRIGYDESHLYMSGRMYDSDPDGIRINTLYRDQFSGDDLLSIMIDSYNDYETALWFVTTPAGTRSDRSMANDAEFTGGGMPMNSDWNAHWDVATTRDDQGWYAEFRIPFATLGFQTVGDEITMGVIVYRFIARKNERHLHPWISQEWGGFGFGKPSQAQRVTLEGVRASSPLYVTPYVLGRAEETPRFDAIMDGAAEGVALDSAWFRDQKFAPEPGLDVKFTPSPNLALDFSVNTDFAQVEVDNQQVNLTRFSLFFPEKRQFFQSRASTFDFAVGGARDRLFYSRRIGCGGLSGCDPVRIYGGGRAVGRAGELDYGILSMQTAPDGDLSGENMSVARLKARVMNPYSYVGTMVTSRLNNHGQNNIAYGMDAQLRLVGDEYLTVSWAHTFDQELGVMNPLESGLFRARWERRHDQGFYYGGEYRRIGGGYRPQMGFQLRNDHTFWGTRVGHTWVKGNDSALRTVSLDLMSTNYFRLSDGTPESRGITPTLALEFRSGGRFSFAVQRTFESIREEFTATGLTVERGEHWFQTFNVNWMLPRSGLFRGNISGAVGDFYDGRGAIFGFSPTWTVSKHLELQANYSVNRIEFASRQEYATTHLASLRLGTAINAHISLSALAQYNTLSEQASVNARFRYHFREGTDLWAVYTDGLDYARDLTARHVSPLSTGRVLMLKYTHTLGF